MQTVPEQGLLNAHASMLATEEGPAADFDLESRFGSWPERLVVLGLTVFVFIELKPSLLFGPNLDVGGDNAAHVAAVSYFIHHLLAHGKLSGWDPQWFGGFPLYVFYFPLPAVLVAVFNVVLPFNVAFNIVTALGSLLLPAACYSFGRLAGFRRPVPVVMAVFSLAFLFNTSFTIDGGNIASTLAGEFSFSLAIPLGLFFLGVYARSLRTGKGRVLGAILFSATVLCHVVPAIFYFVAACVIALMQADRRRALGVFVTTCGVGGLLAGFWLLRFAADLGYSSSMNYTRVGDVFGHFFPRTLELAVQILAGVGLVLALKRRQVIVIAFGVLSALSLYAFALLPDGLIYNERWEPFWFLATTLMAAYGLSEGIRTVASALLITKRLYAPATMTFSAAAMVIILMINLNGLPGIATPSAWRSFLPGWAQWNYSGYQSKSGWPEFQRVSAMLAAAGARYGCGRLGYEYTANATDPFGSTLVEMSWPYWTNGCIQTTEGLYYESSTSNDFHFLDQSELSIDSSDPVAGLPYQGLNVADGVTHLRLAGVRYFLANSAEVEDQAGGDPYLVKIASTPASSDVVEASPPGTPGADHPQWVLYRILDSNLVSPLSHQPVLEAGQSKRTWLNTAIAWYQHPGNWSVVIARSGPRGWPQAAAGTLPAPNSTPRLAATRVSTVHTTADSISFDVTHVGVPVLVKIPYFPNWQASGAAGPWEATPNLMLVVPTARHVTLRYGVTGIDWLARIASLLGLLGLIALWRWPLDPADGLQRSRGAPARDATSATALALDGDD